MFGLESIIHQMMATQGLYQQPVQQVADYEMIKRLQQAQTGQLKVAKVEEVKVADIQTIPDVSLTRVLKWAVVLLVAMGLGKRVWALFGDKITAQVHKAIGEG